MSNKMVPCIKNLIKCHNILVDSTQQIVKSHCKHVKIDYLKVNKDTDLNEITDKLHKLSNYISRPQYSYLYSRYATK